MSEQRRILLSHAHPDDESCATGGTIAKYVAEGAHVTVVTCTRGEQGKIAVAELAHLAADQQDLLGDRRSAELRNALAALGVDDHRYLGGDLGVLVNAIRILVDVGVDPHVWVVGLLSF